MASSRCINSVVQVVVDQSLRQDVAEVVHADSLHVVVVGYMVPGKLPTIGCQNAMQGTMQAEPTVLSQPDLLQRKVVLPRLVMVVHFRGVLEIAGYDAITRDFSCAKVTILIGPTLHLGNPIIHVGNSCSAHKEKDLLAIILVAYSVEVFPFNFGL